MTEAEYLRGALQNIGVHVYDKEWSDFQSLRDTLNSQVKTFKDDSSLLIVCIMAHGFAGHIQGSYEGGHGEINILFKDISKLLPKHIPVVSDEVDVVSIQQLISWIIRSKAIKFCKPSHSQPLLTLKCYFETVELRPEVKASGRLSKGFDIFVAKFI